ncbi:MAG: hypothetical protein O3A00_25870 [Planctomycetota bacterium]|nr:hypothetical protein [Planctomycetota bacterium]
MVGSTIANAFSERITGFERLDSGALRRVARMTSPTLWGVGLNTASRKRSLRRTRSIVRITGGRLLINANAAGGELRVRVSDEDREPLAGLNYDDCHTFSGDQVSHEVTWERGSLDTLKGQVIRLEYYLKNAELFTFQASK